MQIRMYFLCIPACRCKSKEKGKLTVVFGEYVESDGGIAPSILVSAAALAQSSRTARCSSSPAAAASASSTTVAAVSGR